MDEAGQGIVLSSSPKCGGPVARVGHIDRSRLSERDLGRRLTVSERNDLLAGQATKPVTGALQLKTYARECGHSKAPHPTAAALLPLGVFCLTSGRRA